MNNDKEVEDFFKHYHDRGMIKWTGFYLSDHSLKLNKLKKEEEFVETKKETMSIEEISKCLFKAFSEERQVLIQLNILNQEGRRLSSYQGHVLGVLNNQVIIDKQIFAISNINNVEIVTVK